ncbi:VOC family protein [Roseateles terrae]|uniref:Enzyme related to lactoylglutathione lyase n=1 Tax=Roseateles terrae TaxID=431060 RepID=A0ABR6GPG0_9BURK|nr:VOC family protein [Roseateles terrae]MBB3193124.1 putative enzyme related to lactoylglutathione lyase [Roseateles terrae]OWQ89646.1 glyoxalase [Roseateles terrae]
MKRVTGIGGIFFKSKDPAALRAWYQQHLGIEVDAWGGASFRWEDDAGQPVKGVTAWSVQPDDIDTDDFGPASPGFMINYRVHDLPALLQALRQEGCQVLERMDESEYGKFGWVIDPEGRKVELWEPPHAA